MQIPKQPRIKSPASEASQPESKPADNQASHPASAVEDVNKELQQVYSSYLEDVTSTNLQAQYQHAQAYLTYLETLQQQSGKSGSDPLLDYYKEILHAGDDANATTQAQRKLASAIIDRQAIYQNALADAVATYSQATRDLLEKLHRELGEHNKKIAESYKDALLKVDVSTANLPALSALYQGVRMTRVAPAPADPGKSG